MSTRGAARSALTIAALTSLLISPVQAAPDAGDEALLREGVQLRRQGNDEAALAAFQSAWRINPTARALGQIGLAEQALGHWVAAERDLKRALEAKTDPWIAKNASSLSQALKLVSERLAQLQVLGSPTGAQVKVDGQEIGHLPMQQSASVLAGEVVISVTAPGYISINRKVMVPAKGSAREIVVLHPAEPPATVAPHVLSASPPAASADAATAPPTVAAGSAPTGLDGVTGGAGADAGAGRPWQRTGAFVAAGAGVLLLGGAVGAHLLSASKNSEFNEVTNAPNFTGLCNARLDDAGGGPCQGLLDKADTYFTVATVGYVAAGAAFATSLVLHLAAPSGGRGTSTTAFACGPREGNGGLSCALSSSF